MSSPTPSSISLDPPAHNMLPEPKAMRETTQAAANDPWPIPTLPNETSSTQQIIERKLRILAEFMQSRPANAPLVKVIAVDGSDRHAVHSLMAILHHRITRNLRYVVRILDIDPVVPSNNHPTELPHFVRRIQAWDQAWDMLWYDIFNAYHASTHPAYRMGPLDSPQVYILPMSPLMVTTQALHGTLVSNDQWRFLSSYWKHSFRPDVTINIQDIADTNHQYEVLRFQANSMNALIITKQGNTGLHITSSQMRRVVFETEEWIRWQM